MKVNRIIIKENEEENSQSRMSADYENPQSRMSIDYDIHLIPKGNIEDAISALKNIDNYGSYVSNMRNKAYVEKAIEDYFGPSVPVKRKALEKERGKPFPIKTKSAIDDLIKSVTSTPNLLKYEVKGKEIIFPKANNPNKDLTKKIIKVIMDNAGIEFEIFEKETVSEIKMKKSKLKEIIKEWILEELKK